MDTIFDFVKRLKELRKPKFSNAQRLESEAKKLLPGNTFFPVKIISLWESGKRKYRQEKYFDIVRVIDQVLDAKGELYELYTVGKQDAEVHQARKEIDVFAISDIASLIPQQFRNNHCISILVIEIVNLLRAMNIEIDPRNQELQDFVNCAVKLITNKKYES